MSLREQVAELMATAHLISRELASYHAARMSEDELEKRMEMYFRAYLGNGVECRGRNKQSGQRAFYPVLTPRDDDGTAAALDPVPELPTEQETRQNPARFGGKEPGPMVDRARSASH